MKDGNPQIEDGYTRIANELLEAITKKCKGPEAIFFSVIRETYGYKGYKSNEISNKRMCELSGISPDHINRAIKNAVEKGYIFTAKGGDRTHPTYAINKKYLTWNHRQNWRKPPKVAKPTAKSGEKFAKTGDVPYKETRKKPKEKKRAVKWPTDFKMTDKMKQYATDHDINPKKLDLFFEDFHNSADKNELTYKNWEAAFRTWVVKAKEYGKQFLKSEGRAW